METSPGSSYNLRREVILPTFLKEFFVDEQEIELVYDKRDVKENKGSSPDMHMKKENGNTSSNDLTGNPLKVDLEGDESFGAYVNDKKTNYWSVEESTHFPLNIKTARIYLNQQYKIKKGEGEKELPIYVVCDGNNPYRTVLLGEQKSIGMIMTSCINIVGCLARDNKVISLEAIENDHVKNTRLKNPKIDYFVKLRYFLYGNGVQLLKNIKNEHYGSISVEITCNRCTFNAPKNPTNMKMVLQVIAGHSLSSVYFLWEELLLLQKYLDILSDSDKCYDEYTVLSANSLDEPEIYKNLNNIVTTKLLQREAKKQFDLKHLRQEQILDELWNVLKGSENLSVLRDSLHYFFEELVDAETNVQIPESDRSNVATLINGILNGKLAVPTLTYAQALECLYELGAEKLKNDYQAILKNFFSSSEQTIRLKWSQFKNVEFAPQGNCRKTRITVNLKSGVIDLSHNTSKLAYLGKLHVASEVLFLIKDQANLPEDTFDYFCERVYKNYVDTEASTFDFVDLLNSPICEFSINLNGTNIIQNETPATWTMQMTSKVWNTEITTTYHLSEYPIFPYVIYDNYDLSNVTGENKMVYYVSKLQQHKEFL